MSEALGNTGTSKFLKNQMKPLRYLQKSLQMLLHCTNNIRNKRTIVISAISLVIS